ncbi:RagB/SusD family nutrient uptake outer membrane protein [Chitinophaga agrisoli]|uniref:RagB/SusD family nutrient uptake outer membrane protein n=1 Tax=Chitinophaga agrisoli TaxID=2607653 RepID=A0A5B2VZ33_9BACT|nr:RagB/SusD family nutrient uptake outer membrane protein [Chitinophaga agrisoli]KAA2245073.1 RagB/SusD family nutrient uptake outer membrane protein [Chitinophaga agrisoli]
MQIRKPIYSAILLLFFTACSNSFLDLKPKGVLLEEQLYTNSGVNSLLISAYSLMDGQGAGNTSYHSSADNWVYGSVAADDAYKGTTSGDQPAISLIETYQILSDNDYFRGKWRAVYDGVARCNDVIHVLEKTPADEVADAERTRITAEARFLRGHYHFEAKKMWNHVPYIDDKTYNPEDPESTKVPNTEDIWPKIQEDLKFAFDNLPPRQLQPGRATKWAAAALLAKAYLFQQKYTEAKALLDQIVTQGGYSLVERYADNFRAATNNNIESILEVEHSVNDGAPNGENGNNGATLNYPYGGPTTCCGFFQPSQNLVNAFKTDLNGLPMLDTFNDADVTNDQGIESKDPFTPYAGQLDPRLDWTVGRRGIPYLDHGLHPGKAWIRDQPYAGPYSPKKHMFYKADIGSATFTNNARQNANNYRMIRYSHVLLWLAECEIEVGSLERARELVNMIRQRASNPAGFVKMPDGTNAANYVIGLYTTPWADKALARKAVRFEERLEFGMEGHRFFDLVRWGIAQQVLNTYVDKEKLKRTYKSVAVFKPENIYYPIPLQEIVNSAKNGQPTLTQNQGY